MTQFFLENKKVVPVTILDYSECRIVKGMKNSGCFVAIGYKIKQKKPDIGIYGSNNVPEYSIKVDSSVNEIDNLKPGDLVDVTGTSKGKGFAGVVRMWGFKGGKRTHGQSDRQRHPGSIGAGTTTGRVFKGLKMGRRKGGEKVTIRNLRIISVDYEKKLIAVSGSVPGSYNSIIKITKK